MAMRIIVACKVNLSHRLFDLLYPRGGTKYEDPERCTGRRDRHRCRKLHGEGPVKRRIMDMGITKGWRSTSAKGAPLGDPMELTVRNYELSVRKADAEMIEVV